MSRGYERCDIMTDQYFVESLKEGTRKKRGDDGSTIQFTGDTQFPSNFGDFLSNSVDKNSSILSVDAIHNPKEKYGKGKSTFWDAWMSFSKSAELTHTFIDLGISPLAISEENLRLLELFILYVYFGKNHRYTGINEARCTSFFKSPNPKLKDTVSDALIEHIKRSAYQAGWL